MLVALAFWLFLLCAFTIVWLNGDREARQFIAIVLGASVLTAIAMVTTTHQMHALTILAIDAGLLVAALIFVARSRAFWPIWFAGFQSITVATELARQIFPHAIPALYGNAAAFWAIPAIATMTVAVVKDNRARHRGAAGIIR